MHMKFETEIPKQTWVTLLKACQAAILKLTLLKINRLLPIYTSIVPLKLGVDIQSQTKDTVWKPKKNNMATKRQFWKWCRWKSIGFCLWPPLTCIRNLKLKLFYSILFYSILLYYILFYSILFYIIWNFKANLTYTPETMLPTKSRNRKIQYGCQAAILKMTSLKINRLLSIYMIYISIVPLKFGVDIQSQSKVRVWKPKKIQYGRQAAILKVMSLKINRLLPMATINMHIE